MLNVAELFEYKANRMGFKEIPVNELTEGALVYVPYLAKSAIISGVGTPVVKAGDFVLDDSDRVLVDPETLMTAEERELWEKAKELENKIRLRAVERGSWFNG